MFALGNDLVSGNFAILTGVQWAARRGQLLADVGAMCMELRRVATRSLYACCGRGAWYTRKQWDEELCCHHGVSAVCCRFLCNCFLCFSIFSLSGALSLLAHPSLSLSFSLPLLSCLLYFSLPLLLLSYSLSLSVTPSFCIPRHR